MSIKYSEYRFVFDDVQFGIDLRERRASKPLTQKQVGELIGHESGAICTALENGRYERHLMMCDFMALCLLFDLHPFDYFDLQRSE